MLTTEEEAGTKWCPFVRVEGENRAYDTEGMLSSGRSFHCIGSYCMAWRTLHVGQGKPGPRDQGYCGLAGRPEFLKSADALGAPRSRRMAMAGAL
jgi:hypothetical protein